MDDTMKRSERFYDKSRRTLLQALLLLSASVAGCVWSVALITPLPSGGMLAAALGVTGLAYAGAQVREAYRLARLARKEERWEWERSIRPRI